MQGSHFNLFKHLTPQEPDAQIAANETAARARGLPDIASLPRPGHPHLAIVGGGPSINKRVNALRNWHGTVWAINGAALWCRERGVQCTFFTSDASTAHDPNLKGNVSSAILSARCDPWLFDLLRGATIAIYDLPLDQLGPNSAGTACLLATRFCGYTHVTFFGCEGSYTRDSHHAYDAAGWDGDRELLIECAGEWFLTRADILLTTRAIAWTIRKFPDKVKERSGGLLSAMVKDYDYMVIGVSPSLAVPATPKTLIDQYLAYMEGKQMQRILTPVLPHQRRLEVIKDLSGGRVIKIGDEAVLLSPRQTYDFALSLLKAIGVEINIIQPPAAQAGEELKNNIKLAF